MPHEYGYLSEESNEIQWPDDDGDLNVYDGEKQHGYVRCDGYHAPIDPTAEEIEELQRAADYTGRVLVRREVGDIEPVPRG